MKSTWQRQFVLGIFPLLAGLQLLSIAVFLPQALHGYADFRQLYAGAYMMRAGLRHDLYDLQLQGQVQNSLISNAAIVLPANHPSYEYMLLAPLSFLRYKVAYLAWMAVNLAVLFFCVRWLPLHGNWWLKIFLVLGFAPLSITLIHGQDALWFLLILLAAFRVEDEEFISGLVVGLGAFRFHLLLPILLAYVIWKKWKFIAGVLTSGGTLAVISVALVGVRGSLLYLQMARASTGIWPELRITLLNFLEMLCGSHRAVAVAIWGACVLLGMVAISRSKPSLATAVLSIPIFSFQMLPHDYLTLLLPIALSLETDWMAAAQYLGAVFCIFPPLGFVSSLPASIWLLSRCCSRASQRSRSCSRLALAGNSDSDKTAVPSSAGNERLCQPVN